MGYTIRRAKNFKHKAFVRKADIRYSLLWFRERVEMQFLIRQRANMDLIESCEEKM
jgi:hypothetical protein